MCFGLLKKTVDQPISLAKQRLVCRLLKKLTKLVLVAFAIEQRITLLFKISDDNIDVPTIDYIFRQQSFKQPSIRRRNFYMEFSNIISNMVESLETLAFKDDVNSTLCLNRCRKTSNSKAASMDAIHHYPENQLTYPNDLQLMEKAI